LDEGDQAVMVRTGSLISGFQIRRPRGSQHAVEGDGGTFRIVDVPVEAFGDALATLPEARPVRVQQMDPGLVPAPIEPGGPTGRSTYGPLLRHSMILLGCVDILLGLKAGDSYGAQGRH